MTGLLLALCLGAGGCRSYSADWDPAYQRWFESRAEGAVVRTVHDEFTTPSGSSLSVEPDGWASTVTLQARDGSGAKAIALPASPDGGRSYASIVGALDDQHVAVMLRYTGPGSSWTPPADEEDRGAVVVCDLRAGRVTSTVKSLHGDEPHLSLRLGEIWISKQDRSSLDRPDRGSWEVGGHPGQRSNSIQVLHRLSAAGALEPTGVTLICQPEQIWVDHARRLIYATDAQGVTLEERSADGSLVRSWKKPDRMSQIEAVWPGFDERRLRVTGVGQFSSGLATSRHVFAFDPATGEWSWLGTYSQTMPMMNI